MRPSVALVILALALTTYLTRAPLLIWLGARRLPGWLERCFATLPVAILIALALPLVVLSDGRLAGPLRAEVAGAVVAAVVGRYRENLLLPVAAAVAVVAAIRALVR